MALQNDVLSIPARRLVALLKALHSDEHEADAALKLLSTWDGTLDSNSPQAALEEVWYSRYLGPAFKEALLSKAAAFLQAHPSSFGEVIEKQFSEFPLHGNLRKRREYSIECRVALMLSIASRHA